MSITKSGTVFAVVVAILLATAAPSSAATTQYWKGDLAMNQIKSSGSYTSPGGRTELGATGHYARNQSAQYGYAYAEATALGYVTLTHAPRTNTNNWASWTTNGPHIPGVVTVVGKVNH